jgi:ubiquinone/menaquinone biosynthesis C-methylase UbiE
MEESTLATRSAISGGKKARPLPEAGRLSKTAAPGGDYVLGHSQREIRRLTTQAAILRPITERLMRNMRVGPGMRVLDLGCGAGDVSMLAAELVGSTGSVVGIDRNKDVLAVAAERARLAGFPQIHFEQASAETFWSGEPFDLVIGRYVLIHQSDPAGLLRGAARLVRRGGSIAFHEIRLNEILNSSPYVPLWQLTGSLIEMACHSALSHYDVSDRLIECFSEAGLPQPQLFSETPVGGGVDSPLYAWAAETLNSFRPQLTKMGIASSGFTGVETLASSLRAAVVDARSQITAPRQVCAWVTV